MAEKFDQDKDRIYGDSWDWIDDNGSWDGLGDNEPPVIIPEATVKNHNKAVVASAIGLLGLGLAAGAAITVKQVKRHKRGE